MAYPLVRVVLASCERHEQRAMSDTEAIFLNGKPHLIAGPTTIQQLLQELRLNPQQVAVEVNTQLVARESHAVHPLAPGDRVEIVTLVGGG